jgi:hypothetical protein
MIVDKSFVHMLSIAELFELNVFFEFLSTPTLRYEIIGDLQSLKRSKTKNLEVVRKLSANMSRSAIEPMEFRKAALNELAGYLKIPLTGAVPIDFDTPGVSGRNGGVFIDGTIPQKQWKRWAAGDFTAEEENEGANYRRQTEEFDPQAFATERRGWAKERFPQIKNLESLIEFTDKLFVAFDVLTQEMLLGTALIHLAAPPEIESAAKARLAHVSNMRLIDIAPYAASIAKLWFIYIIGLARGIIGPRRSDVRDLEYLFYAPFCDVFVSNDALQARLWPAASSQAFFCNGQRLKEDLAMRARLRAANPARVAGMRPVPIEGSVVSEAFEAIRIKRQKNDT